MKLGKLVLILVIVGFESGSTASAADPPIQLSLGPQLFVDNYLIANSDLARTIRPPTKISQPLVTGIDDHVYSPYVSVLRDPATQKYRMWYDAYIQQSGYDPRLGYLESEDAIHWTRPHQVLATPWTGTGMGATVIDGGPNCPNPSARYKWAWWGDENGRGRGGQMAVSADGLTWSAIASGPEIAADHDIISIAHDTLRKQYVASCSTLSCPGFVGLRIPTQSVSTDLVNWTTPTPTITPDSRDSGEMQFYGMAGVVTRGNLMIANLKVLRNDLVAEGAPPEVLAAPQESKGIGYTVLAWSRDGVTWQRDTEPFIDRDHTPGTWDHAMAWGDYQMVVGDKTYIYYGGYKWGHKWNRYTERNFGLATMDRDRYVSRDAGPTTTGTLTTPVFVSEADRITINASVAGELNVRILDKDGQPLPGFGWSDFSTIHGDSVSHAAQWAGEFSTLCGRPIALEFSLTNGQLYGFDLIRLPEPGSAALSGIGTCGLFGLRALGRLAVVRQRHQKMIPRVK